MKRDQTIPLNEFVWKSSEYGTVEQCRVIQRETEIQVRSAIFGKYRGLDIQVDYEIRTDPAWRVTSCRVKSLVGTRSTELLLEHLSDGWTSGGVATTWNDRCVDIDISLTPFTNTLPIKRLNLLVGASATIDVVYIDILNGDAFPVQQTYRRISESVFRFETVPNDFEADITVSPNGFVVDYPELFWLETKQ